jgi:predicted DNA-binding protein YlxM (UPF0122 family)
LLNYEEKLSLLSKYNIREEKYKIAIDDIEDRFKLSDEAINYIKKLFEDINNS